MSGTTDRPIPVGVVGLGHFGRLHAEKMAEAAGAKLVAVADIDGGRATDVAATHGVEAVTDFRDLVGKVEAVSVVVPTVSHYEVARALVEHGVHVLVEKPIAHDVDCADQLIECARRNDAILQVGHLVRFTGMVETLRERVEQPLYIESIRIAPYKPRGTDVNVVLDLMIHDLDLILCLVDAPIISIDAAGAPVISDHEDIASARVKFADGCIANISASRISLKTERRMRLFQSDCYVTVDFDNHTIRTIRRTEAGQTPSPLNIETKEERYEEGDPLAREIDAFLTAVRKRQTPLVTGEDGRRALTAASMVNASLKSHLEFVRGARTAGLRPRP